jgi:hypothetical protein
MASHEPRVQEAGDGTPDDEQANTNHGKPLL